MCIRRMESFGVCAGLLRHYLHRLCGNVVPLSTQYDIKYLTMTEKKRMKYLNLVKKRAYTLNQYESTGKEKYLRKVDAIDKVLDELVIVMDQTRRLCG